jgi:hypothetical protein
LRSELFPTLGRPTMTTLGTDMRSLYSAAHFIYSEVRHQIRADLSVIRVFHGDLLTPLD